MKLDRLTSEERMKKFYSGEKIDRVPFISSATMYAGNLMGLSSEEFYFDVEKSYNAQKWVIDMHCCDGSPCLDIPNGEVLDFGGELVIRGNSGVKLPIVNHPIKNIKDAINYKLPDVESWKFLNKNIEFEKYARKKGKNGVSITAGSAFTFVGSMVEMTQLLKWIRKEPELVEYLIGIAEEYILKSADIMIEEFGVENCSVSSNYPFENNSILSPKMVEKISMPSILRIYKKLKEKGLKSFGMHLCGNHNKNLELFRDVNLEEGSFISLDERNDLSKVREILGDKYIYAGNVPSNLLVEGSPEEVYKASVEAIKIMKDNKHGFILMPSCDLPINTKPTNLFAMLKACREEGSYI